MQYVRSGVRASASLSRLPAFYPAVTPGNAADLHSTDSRALDSGSEIEDMGEFTVEENSRSASTGRYNINICKEAILSHPLFPLLGLLFERCETATVGPEVVQAPNNFNADLHGFLQHQERAGLPLSTAHQDVDELMVTAIQVMHIYLLELEKVQDLCKDFCNRYITSLKTKLQSDVLFSDSDGEEVTSAPTNSASLQVQREIPASVEQLPSIARPLRPFPSVDIQHASSGTVYQMLPTPRGLVAHPVPVRPVFGIPEAAQENSLPGFSGSFDDYDGGDGKKGFKRGVLPKQATQIMKSWLFQHIVHPYPNEDEKREIAEQTNLSLLQVNNWFINARRRILHPMMEHRESRSAGGGPVRRTKKASARPLSHWPESIAKLQPQLDLRQQCTPDELRTERGRSVAKRENSDRCSPMDSSGSLNINPNSLKLDIEHKSVVG